MIGRFAWSLLFVASSFAAAPRSAGAAEGPFADELGLVCYYSRQNPRPAPAPCTFVITCARKKGMERVEIPVKCPLSGEGGITPEGCTRIPSFGKGMPRDFFGKKTKSEIDADSSDPACRVLAPPAIATPPSSGGMKSSGT